MLSLQFLRGPCVDFIISILEKFSSLGDMGLEAKDKLDSPVPMDTDSEEKHNEGVGTKDNFRGEL